METVLQGDTQRSYVKDTCFSPWNFLPPIALTEESLLKRRGLEHVILCIWSASLAQMTSNLLFLKQGWVFTLQRCMDTYLTDLHRCGSLMLRVYFFHLWYFCDSHLEYDMGCTNPLPLMCQQNPWISVAQLQWLHRAGSCQLMQSWLQQ